MTERPDRRKQKRIALAIASGLFVAWTFFGQWYTTASIPTRIDSNTHGFTVRAYRVRSPIRVLTEMLDFMPHGGKKTKIGFDHGYRVYLCKGRRRIERTPRNTPAAPASVRADGAYYAFFPYGEEPELEVIRADGGRSLRFDLPELGCIRWVADDTLRIVTRAPADEAEVLAELTLPTEFLR